MSSLQHLIQFSFSRYVNDLIHYFILLFKFPLQIKTESRCTCANVAAFSHWFHRILCLFKLVSVPCFDFQRDSELNLPERNPVWSQSSTRSGKLSAGPGESVRCETPVQLRLLSGGLNTCLSVSDNNMHMNRLLGVCAVPCPPFSVRWFHSERIILSENISAPTATSAGSRESWLSVHLFDRCSVFTSWCLNSLWSSLSHTHTRARLPWEQQPVNIHCVINKQVSTVTKKNFTEEQKSGQVRWNAWWEMVFIVVCRT